MLQQWLADHFSLPINAITLESMTGDAGFRQYFRFLVAGQSYIAVDAPNDKSNNQAFINIQQSFSQQAIRVPELIAVDMENGFFCLSDFGDILLADVITPENMSDYYSTAIKLLPKIATAQVNTNYKLAIYDQDFIKLELDIFTEWLIEEHLQLKLKENEKKELESCFDILSNSAVEQPQIVMHRDYHSRNIMLLNADERNQNKINENITLGIIDFQDAVIGPVTYDIVSLLRDCYVRWPDEMIEPLFKLYCLEIVKQIPELVQSIEDEAKWKRWFDLMGLQRHIKASGIFARLHHRDHKSSYLKDIPLTLTYIQDISAMYPELSFLHSFIKGRVLPAILAR